MKCDDDTRRYQALHGWLASILDGQDFTLTPASGDASFRRYFRAVAQERTWIVMDAPPDKESCAGFVHVAKRLGGSGLNVPDVLAADLQSGFLLLRDLGDRQYLDVLNRSDDNGGEDESVAGTSADALYADAIDALVTLQQCPTDGLPVYDRELLHAELSLFDQWFLKRHLGIVLTQTERQTLMQSYDLLCDAALAQQTVFVHRDYHSRNLMWQRERNPGILDFQDAVRGPVSYDLVSLLRDVYVRWPAQRVAGWLDDYRALAHARGVLEEKDRDAFIIAFDRMGAQRHLKIAGIFARLCHRDGKAAYLRDIPLTLDYLFEECADDASLQPLLGLLHDLCVREQTRERNHIALNS